MEYIVTFLQYIIYFWIIEEFFNSFFDEKRELSMVFRMCIWCILFFLNFYFLNWIGAKYLLNFILQTAFMGCACYEFEGRELSIGQWQKLAIARGIFKESSIIVLDEPTAALDPVMETNILKLFLQISNKKTAIIVSHRIGICREVDKIIVMKNGKLVEIGTHNELLQKKGEYYQLYKMQQKWYVE